MSAAPVISCFSSSAFKAANFGDVAMTLAPRCVPPRPSSPHPLLHFRVICTFYFPVHPLCVRQVRSIMFDPVNTTILRQALLCSLMYLSPTFSWKRRASRASILELLRTPLSPTFCVISFSKYLSPSYNIARPLSINIAPPLLLPSKLPARVPAHKMANEVERGFREIPSQCHHRARLPASCLST